MGRVAEVGWLTQNLKCDQSWKIQNCVAEKYLNKFIPSSGNNQRILAGRTEPHAADPVLVAVLRDGVFALSQSVPQFDAAIA
jgi:hypothetical protein